GFDLQHVAKISITVIIGKYPEGSSDRIVSGMFTMSSFGLFPSKVLLDVAAPPNTDRVTRDLNNLGYEMRKLRWNREQNGFFVGMNYPWNHYGWDIGKNPYGLPENSGWSNPDSRQKLLEDFTHLKSIGIQVVRIYVFFDLRTGIMFDDNHAF